MAGSIRAAKTSSSTGPFSLAAAVPSAINWLGSNDWALDWTSLATGLPEAASADFSPGLFARLPEPGEDRISSLSPVGRVPSLRPEARVRLARSGEAARDV